MALREIVVDGDPILRKISRPVEKFDSKLATLLDDMAETMYLDNRGIGIAAVQIGILRRIFVVDVGDEHGKLEFINPEIYEREGAQLYLEGCLSCPGKNGYVERPERIRVSGSTLRQKVFLRSASATNTIISTVLSSSTRSLN